MRHSAFKNAETVKDSFISFRIYMITTEYPNPCQICNFSHDFMIQSWQDPDKKKKQNSSPVDHRRKNVRFLNYL